MHKSLTDKTLALAGLFQAVSLVQQIARRGNADTAAYEACMRSIFCLDPPDTETVYGGAEALALGLAQLQNLLGGGRDQPQELEVVKYAVTVLHLERQLAKRPQMLQQIGERMKRTGHQTEHYPLTHQNVAANLADLYVETISTLTPRIMVSGEQGYIAAPENANKIRALLLAAIRSAVLWRQCGGGRLWLLLRRGELVREAGRLRGSLGL